MQPFKCTLAIGTNLGNREENIKSSLSLIHSQISPNNITQNNITQQKITQTHTSKSFICTSSIIETQALLLPNSPPEWNIPYLNCVIELQTNLLPEEILTEIKKIETQMGRSLSAPQWSPRIIDIDILFHTTQPYSSPTLTIPHPQISSREFLKRLLKEFQEEL